MGDESHDADERDDDLIERRGLRFVVTLLGRRAIRRRAVPHRDDAHVAVDARDC